MINPDDNTDAANSKHNKDSTQVKSNMSKSMHDGVEVWCDCCSCEAEPYWVEAMQEYDKRNSGNKD